MIVYYSTPSENTHRFVQKLGLPSVRLPIEAVDEPFVLVTPTYNGRVPEPVSRFLQNTANSVFMRGVIAGGSTNFGSDFGAAARAISEEYGVPHLHTFELTGLREDVETVKSKVHQLWNHERLTAISTP